MTTSTLTAMASVVGHSVAPEKGQLAVAIGDCSGGRAAGARLQVRGAEGAVAWYLLDGLPSPGATVTDSSGLGGFLNVPPSVYSVEAYIAETDELIGKTSAIVRAGVFTYVALEPTP